MVDEAPLDPIEPGVASAAADPFDAPPVGDPEAPPGRDMRLAGLVSAFAVLVACGQVGAIIFPTLIKRSPVLLLALSSRMRHLLFAVPAGINPFGYAIVGFVRLSIAAWVCYGLGYFYGDRGVLWLEKQVQGDTPATFRWLQRAADRAGAPLTFFMPGSNIVCVLVGQRKMARQKFAVWLSAGIVFRLIWLWVAAKLFDSQLKSILKFIERYQWWLVAAFFIITVLQSTVKAARQGPPPKRS